LVLEQVLTKTTPYELVYGTIADVTSTFQMYSNGSSLHAINTYNDRVTPTKLTHFLVSLLCSPSNDIKLIKVNPDYYMQFFDSEKLFSIKVLIWIYNYFINVKAIRKTNV
jgi:hypothetical protein